MKRLLLVLVLVLVVSGLLGCKPFPVMETPTSTTTPTPMPSLIGSVALIYEPNPSQTESQIMNRLHDLGISNPVVQIWNDNQVLIEIPGFQDADQRISFERSLFGEATLRGYAVISDSIGNPMTMKTGSALGFEADLRMKDPSRTDFQVMTDIQSTIEDRIRTLGISNPVVQIWGNNRVFIEIPLEKNVDQVISIIGQQVQGIRLGVVISVSF